MREIYNEIIKLIPCDWSNMSNNEKNYIELLGDILSKYYDIIKIDFDDIKEDVNIIINQINDIANAGYMGTSSSAYNSLHKLMRKYAKAKCLFAIKAKNEMNIYRMRVMKNKRSGISSNDMFHIPFNMRGKIKTQRYSIPGYPCLYMGLSAYGCWEEMKRPRMSDCWISRIKCTEQIRLLDLRIPNIETFVQDPEVYIYRFPLIISCMTRFSNLDDIYKPEYIIPQLIMEWIITAKKLVNGVIYTSMEQGNDFDYPNEKNDNIAIPVMQLTSDTKYCPELVRIFNITNPINLEIEKLKHPKESNIDDYDSLNPIERYKKSDFGYLEERLEHYNTNKITE